MEESVGGSQARTRRSTAHERHISYGDAPALGRQLGVFLEGDAGIRGLNPIIPRFIDDTPWVHMDLFASTCMGGFGVGWGLSFIEWQ